MASAARFNSNHDPKTGQFSSGDGGAASSADVQAPTTWDPVKGGPMSMGDLLGALSAGAPSAMPAVKVPKGSAVPLPASLSAQKGDSPAEVAIKGTMAETWQSLPPKERAALDTFGVTLTVAPLDKTYGDGRLGVYLYGGKNLQVNSQSASPEMTKNVMLHELGHAYDHMLQVKSSGNASTMTTKSATDPLFANMIYHAAQDKSAASRDTRAYVDFIQSVTLRDANPTASLAKEVYADTFSVLHGATNLRGAFSPDVIVKGMPKVYDAVKRTLKLPKH